MDLWKEREYQVRISVANNGRKDQGKAWGYCSKTNFFQDILLL